MLALQDTMKQHQTRFLTQKPAKVVLSSMEVVAQSMGFKTHIRNYKVDQYPFFINIRGHLELHLGLLSLFFSLSFLLQFSWRIRKVSLFVHVYRR